MGSENRNTETIKDIRDLLIAELKNIYWGEKELVTALAKMAEKATSDGLKAALLGHQAKTKEQVARIEEVFLHIEQPAEAKKCEIINSMIKAGEGLMEKTQVGNIRDAAIILAAQKVECYEIALYSGLLWYTELMGDNKTAALLNATLEEEEDANEKLNEVSEDIDVAADKPSDIPRYTNM